ncbi:unnamed protein product [Allacma fusca]|uniref:DUF4806 domain-containing protein n=1 Tax=Allacma fusca TaxID=39272 RepID=A0A8J2JGK4_9HEXA|nr:unnamed protein product [Allacma fusca]
MQRSLKNFKMLLSDHEFRSECLKYLGTIGGSDLTTTVFEPLKKIMTDEVAYLFNFKGVNGISNFSVLHLNDLIFDLVRGNPKTAPESMISVRNKIQAWVLHAGDKLPKEKKRFNNNSSEA